MLSGDETGGIVVDLGTWESKFGFAGEDQPRRLLRHRSIPANDASENVYMAAEPVDSWTKPSSLPDGIWPSEDAILSQWRQGVEEGMRLSDVSAHPCVAVIPTLLSSKDQQNFIRLLFETLQLPAIYLARSAPMCAFASGRSTGLFVEISASGATTCPVVDGYSLLGATRFNPECGGRAFSDRLVSLLNRPDVGRDVIDDIKRTACRVWRIPPFDRALAMELESDAYELPDRTVIQLGPERFESAEHVFAPGTGLASMCRASLGASPAELRRKLANEMILVGGASLMDGVPERLGKDLSGLLPSTFRPKISCPGTPEERRFAPFVGASVLGSLGSFQQLWLSRKEYDECGAERACFERFTQ